MIVEPRHHDVAAFDQAQPSVRLLPQHGLDEGFHPGAGGIDQRACGDHVALAVGVEDEPPLAGALGANAAGARAHDRATLGGVDAH